GSMDVRDRIHDLLLDLLAHLGSLLGHVLLPDRAARAFPRPRIGTGALAAQRQAATVADAAIAAEIHEALDAHRCLTAQVALDDHPRDLATQLLHLRLGQVANLGGGRHAR